MITFNGPLLYKLGFIVVLLRLLVGNCAFAANEINTLKIAIAAPFTGSYAGYGTQLLSGASAAVNKINQNGGIKGIKLEVVPVDDQCDPTNAVSCAHKIIEDKNFQAVIGHACSSAALASQNIYAKAGMLVITPTATNINLTKSGIPTFFRMTGLNDLQAQTATNFLVNKLQSKRVAIIHDGGVYSKELADFVSEHLTQLDKPNVMYMQIERGTKKFNNIITLLEQQDVDAIYFPGMYPEVAALARELNLAQLQVPMMAADGIALNRFVIETGDKKTASSVLMTFVEDPSLLHTSKETINEMKTNNLETNGYALYAFAAVEVIAKAIDKTDTTDGEQLASWIHQNEVETVLGNKAWDTNGNIVGSEFTVYLWNPDATNIKPILS